MIFKYQVMGMTCAACSARVEKVSSRVPGVSRAEVNLLKGTMVVQGENEAVAEAVVKAVYTAGYTAVRLGTKQKQVQTPNLQKLLKKRLVGSGICLIVLMYFTMGHMVGLPVPHWYHGVENGLVAALVQLSLTLPVVYLNRAYYSRGLSALWRRSPNMDSLIAVGSLAALIYGVAALYRMAWAMGHGHWDTVQRYLDNLYFESAAMILTLVTLGKYLEARAKGRTGDAIRQLMDLSPKTAIVLKDGEETELAVEQIQPGDNVLVRSGGRIPIDGTVLEGRGSVDESPLTGESVPVEKEPGHTVAAGTMNTEGYLVVRADKTGEDTTLSQIIRMVEEAGGSKAPIARLADKIAGIFVPVVMTIALVAFAGWMLAGKGLEFSLSVGIAVLVISCPCALGLATPVAIMVGTGRGATLGVLFKNAQALENLYKVDTVVLDKTGTLTQGKPSVTDILPGGVAAQELLSVAAALEAKSEHPFAKAILQQQGKEAYPQTEDFETFPGLGLAATVNSKRCYGGNRRLMEQLGISVPDYKEYTQQGKTPLYFAREDGMYLGAVVAADVLKPESKDAVDAMMKQGLQVVMLTGDNGGTAGAIAQSAGISQVISDVLPPDKAEAIEKLRKQGHRVLMVGDGINDAPALVTADVGMAIGAGTDVAIESADVVLMNSSLMGISTAVALSRATMRNIKQNLFWAFFYNTLGIPIAAGLLYPAFQILLSPMLGAAAMSMSSVFVVSNALRLRGFRPKTIFRQSCEGNTKKSIKEEKTVQTVLKVEGMMCSHCKARVEEVCKAVAGVADAVVDLQAKQVTVTGAVDADLLKQAITAAGYEVVG